jgi:peroxiredoxin
MRHGRHRLDKPPLQRAWPKFMNCTNAMGRSKVQFRAHWHVNGKNGRSAAQSGFTLALTVAITFAANSGAVAYEPKTLETGAPAPAFDLLGTDNKRHTLVDFDGNSVLVVIFTTNHCPDAIASYSRMCRLVDDYRDKGVGFVAINGNDPQAVMLDELRWSKYDDSFESMKKVAKEEKFNLPYLYDGATQEVTKAFGAVATPHVFIFDKSRRLQYAGRLDNGRRNPDYSGKSEARDAIDALLAGKPVSVSKTGVYGCSTKWSDDRALVAKTDHDWNELSVKLAPIDAAGIKTLVANKSSALRLINVWSTTCGPCVSELPALVKTYRRFQNHPFEFITISLDSASEESQVAGLLQEQHVALARRTERLLKGTGRKTNNFIFNGDDLEDVAAAFESHWTGAQPYTQLVAPGGEVLYRQAGDVNFDALNAAIVKFVRANFLK